MRNVQTGYYGKIDADNRIRTSKVHTIVDGKPVCGAPVGSGMLFHFCSFGIRMKYLDCKKCISIGQKHFDGTKTIDLYHK